MQEDRLRSFFSRFGSRFVRLYMDRRRLPLFVAPLILAAVAVWIILGSGDRTVVVAGRDIVSSSARPGASVFVPQEVRSFTSEARPYRRVLRLAGRTAAPRVWEARSRLSGRVERLSVRKGVIVDADSLLLRLAEEDRPARLREAEAVVLRARKHYEVIGALGVRNFESELGVLQAAADLAAAEADLAAIREDVAHLEIRAPFAALVNDNYVEEGDYVRAGDRVFSLVEGHPLLLRVRIGERDYGAVRLGQSVSVHLPDGSMVMGEVDYIAKVADEHTRTFTVEATIDNASYAYPVGVTADMEVRLEGVSAHRIRASHLALSDSGEVGVKILDGGRVRFRSVEILGDEDGILWVRGALPDVVTIIGEGQGFVEDGQEAIGRAMVVNWDN